MAGSRTALQQVWPVCRTPGGREGVPGTGTGEALGEGQGEVLGAIWQLRLGVSPGLPACPLSGHLEARRLKSGSGEGQAQGP